MLNPEFQIPSAETRTLILTLKEIQVAKDKIYMSTYGQAFLYSNQCETMLSEGRKLSCGEDVS